MKKSNTGFTFIELLVVMGIIAILSAIILVAANPSRQFASARDTIRINDIYQLINAVYEYSIENNGSYPPSITSTPTDVGTSGLNLAAYLVQTHIPRIPQDPTSGTQAITQYVMFSDGPRIIASATGELVETITISR